MSCAAERLPARSGDFHLGAAFALGGFGGAHLAVVGVDDLDVAALLVGALVHQASALSDFLGEDRELALRARVLQRFVPEGEVALRPLVAAVKHAPVTGLLL